MEPNSFSLVRWLGSMLPMPKATRMYLQNQLIDGHRLPLTSDDSNEETNTNRCSLADIGWLSQGPSDPEIMSRAEALTSQDPVLTFAGWAGGGTMLDSGYCCTPTHGASVFETPVMRRREIGPPTSTPFELRLPAEDALTNRRIVELEQELAKLRMQMALIVQAQEAAENCIPAPILSCATPTAAPAPPPPPFPPPPPPPPPTSASGPSVNDIIRKRKMDRLQANGEAVDDDVGVIKRRYQQQGPAVDMGTMLKDMGNVRLKAVARSPGGTPVRDTSLRDAANDPASIIARALRKKFAKAVVTSPMSDDGENSPQQQQSTHASVTTPGPHMLRPTGRRVVWH